MSTLEDGYRRFRAGDWQAQSQLYEQLANKGQRPKALVIACVDSRVDPARIFNAGPGELLVVRNVANLVPPYAPDASYHGTSAAIEFGVRVLEVPRLIILGHGMCGGVGALLKGDMAGQFDFVTPWMSIAEKARRTALVCQDPVEQQQVCEHEVIRVSIENLMSYPWLRSRVESGLLQLSGGWFSIATGELKLLDEHGLFQTI